MFHIHNGRLSSPMHAIVYKGRVFTKAECLQRQSVCKVQMFAKGRVLTPLFVKIENNNVRSTA